MVVYTSVLRRKTHINKLGREKSAIDRTSIGFKLGTWKIAVKSGIEALRNGLNALDVVEIAIKAVEDDASVDSVGTGAFQISKELVSWTRASW